MLTEHSAEFLRVGAAPLSRFYSFSSKVRVNPLHAETRVVTNPLEQLEQLRWLVREKQDAEYSIVSRLQGRVWFRNASMASLEPLSDERVAIYNMLLRSISRLSPILYAIFQQRGVYSEPLLEQFQGLLIAVEQARPDLRQLEMNFNQALMNALNDAGLGLGVETKKEAEALLSHYRNLSALLQPTPVMVTISFDHSANVLHREINRPITQKTDTQKQQIRQLRQRPVLTAIDQASQIFTDFECDDERMLPAQARKTHPIGVKNAFLVTTELFFIQVGQNVKDIDFERPYASLTLARLASPVYLGSGPHQKTRVQDTLENLQQILWNAQGKQRLHLTVLNTDTPINKEHTIVATMQQAAQRGGYGFSYTPANLEGTLRRISIAPLLGLSLWGTAPLQKRQRLDTISQVILRAATDQACLSVVNCASGQDRTGTAVQKATEDWIRGQYQHYHRPAQGLAEAYAKGGNAAEITAHLVNGSPGMKTISQANNTFGKGVAFSAEISKRLYLSSADTNKASKLHRFTWSRQAYLSSLNQIIEEIQGQALVADIIADLKALQATALNAKEQRLLLTTATVVKQALGEATVDNMQKLQLLASEMSKKNSKWFRLGGFLIGLALGIAIGLGLAMAIPSLGLSLAVSSVEFISLSSLAAVSAGLGIFSFTRNIFPEKRKLGADLRIFAKNLAYQAPSSSPSPKIHALS